MVFGPLSPAPGVFATFLTSGWLQIGYGLTAGSSKAVDRFIFVPIVSFVSRSKKRGPLPAPSSAVQPRRTSSANISVFANREQSWLAFNRRVLDQARNPANPLLERVKFLAIVSSNLDEFFEIRVAGIMQQADSEAAGLTLDGLTPRENLRQIQKVVNELVGDQYACWHKEIVPLLAVAGIQFRTAAQLNERERAWVREHFQTQVLPVLTPLAIDQSHPFPLLGNKTLNVLVSLDHPETPAQEKLMIILPVPRSLPRIVQIASPGEGALRHMFLSEIIKLCAGTLFPGYHVRGAHAFRVTRNSDLYIDEEEAENLLKRIEEELRNLRRGAAVRLEIEEGVDAELLRALCAHLAIGSEHTIKLKGPLNLFRLMSLYEMIDRPDLKYPPYSAADPTLPQLSLIHI